MIFESCFDVALAESKEALASYRSLILKLSSGISVPMEALERHQCLTHETEQRFRLAQMTLLSMIVDPIRRLDIVKKMDERARIVDTMLAEMDHVLVLYKTMDQ